MIQISDALYSEMLTANDPNLAYPTYVDGFHHVDKRKRKFVGCVIVDEFVPRRQRRWASINSQEIPTILIMTINPKDVDSLFWRR